MNAIIPTPRCPVSIREATMADFAFIDCLQGMHSKQIGFLKKKALEAKINSRQVIVAQEESGLRVGYAIGTDRYFKREDVGIIYHLNVAPEKHRGLIGAQLVQAMFDRAHVSCKLFCLWCAQDIDANHFWESLGFVPLAFRAGSRLKDRIHIFWEKRIQEGDTGGGATPWWYPTQTTGGSLGEARLVFPIPPGVKWSDEMPRVLPASRPCLPGKDWKPVLRKPAATLGRLQFSRPVEKTEEPKPEKPPKLKNDPALIAKARELNARWLEEINSPGGATRLPEPGGKYQVCKQIEARVEKQTALLTAA